MRTNRALFPAVVLIALTGDFAIGSQEAIDMKLEDAGFIMRPANTAAKLRRVKLLLPRQFIRHRKAGKHYYLYADPDYCKCVFVGSERAMQTYRNMVAPAPQPLPGVGGPVAPSGTTPEGALIRDMDSDIGASIAAGDILDFKF